MTTDATTATPLETLAREVLSVPTAPYAEQAVIAYLHRFAAARGLPAWQDEYGNVYVSYRRGRARRPLVLGAHIDHPGFVVTAVRGRRLELEFRGGIADRYGRDEPVRLYHPGEVDSYGTARITRVRGANGRLNGAAATIDQRGIEAAEGDLALWDVSVCRIRGNRVQARQCDDLGGAIAVLATLDRLAARRPSAYVTGLFTRAEEVGLRGASAAARDRTLPEDAVVVAVETSSMAGGRAEQGAGPVIRVGDAVHIFSPAVTRWMTSLASELASEDAAFRFQRKLMDGGVTEATAYDLYGYETGAACVALGNYHNAGPGDRVAAETVDLRDLDGLARLFERMAERMRDLPRALPDLRRRYDGLAREAVRDLRRSARQGPAA